MSAARQRLRRHAAHGALSDGQRGRTHSRGPRRGGDPPPDRFAGHIPRHGWLLDDGHFVRRAADPAVGRSGQDCRLVLVVLRFLENTVYIVMRTWNAATKVIPPCYFKFATPASSGVDGSAAKRQLRTSNPGFRRMSTPFRRNSFR